MMGGCIGPPQNGCNDCKYTNPQYDDNVTVSKSDCVNIPQFDGNMSSLSCDMSESTTDELTSTTIFVNSSFHTSSKDDLPDLPAQKEQWKIPVITNVFKENVQHFPSPPWYEHAMKHKKVRIPVRKTIRRDNRLAKSNQLPVIAVSNLRSLMPKVNSFIEDMHQRDIGLALLTEVWEKAQKKKHIFQIDKMLHMEGLKYISTPRPSSKRGGGAAIVAPIDKYSLEKIDILIPHNLEIVYGLLRPKMVEKVDFS